MNVADVARISDPRERLRKASVLVHKAEEKIEEHRQKRALAVLVMLRPFADAVAETNAERARLRARVDAGDLTIEEYRTALAANREQRQRDLTAAKVTIRPVDVYEMLGVARNLVNRILMRMPVEPLPEVENPDQVAKRAHRAIPHWEETLAEARAIRTRAALILLSGRDEDGAEVEPMSNAEVARVTGLTTARIAQLRDDAGVRV